MWGDIGWFVLGALTGAFGFAVAISPYTRDMWRQLREVRIANKRLEDEVLHLRRNRAAETPDAQYTPKVIESEVRVPPYKSEDWLVNPGGVEYQLDDIANGDWRHE